MISALRERVKIMSTENYWMHMWKNDLGCLCSSVRRTMPHILYMHNNYSIVLMYFVCWSSLCVLLPWQVCTWGCHLSQPTHVSSLDQLWPLLTAVPLVVYITTLWVCIYLYPFSFFSTTSFSHSQCVQTYQTKLDMILDIFCSNYYAGEDINLASCL